MMAEGGSGGSELGRARNLSVAPPEPQVILSREALLAYRPRVEAEMVAVQTSAAAWWAAYGDWQQRWNDEENRIHTLLLADYIPGYLRDKHAALRRLLTGLRARRWTLSPEAVRFKVAAVRRTYRNNYLTMVADELNDSARRQARLSMGQSPRAGDYGTPHAEQWKRLAEFLTYVERSAHAQYAVPVADMQLLDTPPSDQTAPLTATTQGPNHALARPRGNEPEIRFTF